MSFTTTILGAQGTMSWEAKLVNKWEVRRLQESPHPGMPLRCQPSGINEPRHFKSLSLSLILGKEHHLPSLGHTHPAPQGKGRERSLLYDPSRLYPAGRDVIPPEEIRELNGRGGWYFKIKSLLQWNQEWFFSSFLNTFFTCWMSYNDDMLLSSR